MSLRRLVVWFPDWAVTATGHGGDEPVAIVERGRVVARSRAAAALGVTLFERRRRVEAAFSGLIVIERDVALEVRAFEAVVEALSELCIGIEALRPGCLELAARGPARYFGGEEALARRLADAARLATGVPGAPPPRVGIADGHFAALVAASEAVIVGKDKTAAYLAEKPIGLFHEEELCDLLRRLGIDTIGAFVGLGARAIADRFGPMGERLYAQALGNDIPAPLPARVRRELVALAELDPPLERVDTVAFSVRALVDELETALFSHGLCCTRLSIEAETEHGESLGRVWRSESSFSPGAILERLRWQLEGWFSGTVPEARPTAGLTLVRLRVVEAVPDTGRQLGFFGEASDAFSRAARGLDRLCGLLGPEGVLFASLNGGRTPAERFSRRAFGSPGPKAPDERPWPGRLVSPAPALVHLDPLCAEVLDDKGSPLGVLSRGRPTGRPGAISLSGGPFFEIVSFSGPWLYDERWWDASRARHQARLQLVTLAGTGYLCVLEGGKWSVEATYD